MAPKTEIYTWRLSPALKAGLEEAARAQGRSVAELLDEIVAEKLETLERESGEDEGRQRQLHAQAAHFAGCLSGVDSQRSARVRALVRDRLGSRRRSAK
jgi:hypothetical protein